jgi:hypothetical protein
MLHFLRRIRRNLFGTGATRKYILYAIGEILLVMVGILLALQVNNWNESQKEKQNSIKYIKSFCEDLKRDTAHLSGLISYYETKVEKLSVLKFCHDSITRNIPYTQCLTDLYRWSQFFTELKNTDRTLNQLKNSGGMENLENEDAQLLLDYDDLLLIYKIDERTVIQETQTQLRNTMNKIFRFQNSSGSKNSNQHTLLSQNETLVNEYFNILQRYLNYSQTSLDRLDELKFSAIYTMNFFIEKYEIKQN